MSSPSLIVESSSNERLNSSSQSPKYELNGTDDSNPVTFQLSESNPDISIIKDLYPSSCHQLASIHVKSEGLFSLKKSTRKKFLTSQVLGPLTHQTRKVKLVRFNSLIR
ncbi:hypothetical protein AVEN_26694-1 [Araneus ventricosus]|uniref:Uncharacterized protein n=1 Tax=Araneus ventricosus TaxID=182803 RepID=A0A4Y2RIS6_ARAVE|nr:hypothetical protein AVEN_26694-1 [Araneus ventricosus]